MIGAAASGPRWVHTASATGWGESTFAEIAWDKCAARRRAGPWPAACSSPAAWWPSRPRPGWPRDRLGDQPAPAAGRRARHAVVGQRRGGADRRPRQPRCQRPARPARLDHRHQGLGSSCAPAGACASTARPHCIRSSPASAASRWRSRPARLVGQWPTACWVAWARPGTPCRWGGACARPRRAERGEGAGPLALAGRPTSTCSTSPRASPRSRRWAVATASTSRPIPPAAAQSQLTLSTQQGALQLSGDGTIGPRRALPRRGARRAKKGRRCQPAEHHRAARRRRSVISIG